MASSSSYSKSLLILILIVVFPTLMFQFAMGGRSLTELVEPQPNVISYHKGQLLTGQISVDLIWYGKFTSSQRAIISDFVTSLSSSSRKEQLQEQQQKPTVAKWWETTDKYYQQAKSTEAPPTLTLGTQIIDESCSLGKILSSDQIVSLASLGGKRRSINVVLTSEDVVVDGFCMNRCGTHGSSPRSKNGRYTYIWVGNSATQCPGHCAWPFHQPIYGPQVSPLVAPNGDVGVDGMIINLASLLAGTMTNPFGNGFFEDEKSAPLEAASACPGVYGTGAYPGYAGNLLLDPTTGGSYNANGNNGRKYLLPSLIDPTTSTCATLV